MYSCTSGSLGSSHTTMCRRFSNHGGSGGVLRVIGSVARIAVTPTGGLSAASNLKRVFCLQGRRQVALPNLA